MGAFNRLEQRLESVISGGFARAFRSAVQPVEISAALQREVDNNAQILSRNRRMVPNNFTVELSAADLERLAPYDSAMANELRETLREHAESQSYVFPGPVVINFVPDEDLITGRFRITSQAQAKVTARERSDVGSFATSATATLVVNGNEQRLYPPGAVVGRGNDADIQVNDPGVSRQHVEFKLRVNENRPSSPFSVSVHDLGSTNGMLVNGHKLAQSPIENGSVIKIGNTTITLRISDGNNE